MATKSAKANKTTLNKNVERIQKTAKNVNKEVKKTAEVVLDDVWNNSKQLTTMASKTSKKIGFKNSVEQIRKTTGTVNQEIRKTAGAVLEDVTSTSKVSVNKVAVKTKTTIARIDVAEGLNTVKETAVNANKAALKTADEVTKSIFTNGEKWQNVSAKAFKGGIHLAGRQQKIVFDTLEMVKGELAQNAMRFRKLFGNN